MRRITKYVNNILRKIEYVDFWSYDFNYISGDMILYIDFQNDKHCAYRFIINYDYKIPEIECIIKNLLHSFIELDFKKEGENND